MFLTPPISGGVLFYPFGLPLGGGFFDARKEAKHNVWTTAPIPGHAQGHFSRIEVADVSGWDSEG